MVGGSIPSRGTIAEVAKLVDALALGASGVTHGGSSPLLGTVNFNIEAWTGISTTVAGAFQFFSLFRIMKSLSIPARE